MPKVKDVSELYLKDPQRFKQHIDRAKAQAVPWLDIAESGAQERSREAWAACESLALAPNMLDLFVADLRRCGVAGEARVAVILFLALVSRLLERIVSVAVKGPSSVGKSYLVEKVLRFFPESAYYALTAMSERTLAYSEEPIEHRFLVLFEEAGMSGDFATYLIRSLLSEGRLRYETVEKTPEGLRPRLIERKGPTGLIVTTTRVKLHPENETRMLTVAVDDSPEHTAKILEAIAEEGVEPVDLSRWHHFHVWIAHGERRVTIPFAKDLARRVPPRAVRLRRDFESILALIRSHALLYRAQRERDARGRIVATLEDYRVVRDLMADLVSDGVEATVPQETRDTVKAIKKVIEGSAETTANVTQVAKQLGLDKSAASRRVASALNRGYLRNLETGKGRAYKLALGDPMPEDEQILPTPEALLGEECCTVAPFSEGTAPPPPGITVDALNVKEGGGVQFPLKIVAIDQPLGPAENDNRVNGVSVLPTLFDVEMGETATVEEHMKYQERGERQDASKEDWRSHPLDCECDECQWGEF